MTNATTNAAPAATTETTVPAAPAPKAPSKKSLATAIFAHEMARRAAGEFASNKAFRSCVLLRMHLELGVSYASASTMYNAAKKEAEVANPEVGLGRDPKVVKVKTTSGKRGRPVGSKNRPKAVVEVPAAVATTETATPEVATADTTATVVVDLPAAAAVVENAEAVA